jgi:hypothetical protein
LVTGIGRINTPVAWSYLIGIGVDELITDDPLALINYLKQKQSGASLASE